MEEEIKTQDKYLGYTAGDIVMRCPACETFPVKWVKQHGRTNEGEQERYTCEVCDDGEK